MPSYLDDLARDRVRLDRALRGLISEQESAVHRLEADLDSAQARTDRAVLKVFFFTEQFGRGASDTVLAQREAEEANTRLIEVGRKLERQRAVLDMYRQKLAGELGGAEVVPTGGLDEIALVG